MDTPYKVEHTPDHIGRLRDMVLGEAAPEGEVFEELRRCPVCREELEELDSLQGHLRDTGREEELVLKMAAETAALDGDLLVEGFVAARTSEARRRRLRGVLPWVAAAAAVLMALFAWRSFAPPEEPVAPFVLGTAGEGVLSPLGYVGAFPTTFEWDLEREGWFVVHVFSDMDGATTGDPPLASSPRMEAQKCLWSAQQVASWPSRIRWEVRSFDRTGIAIDSAQGRARLRE